MERLLTLLISAVVTMSSVLGVTSSVGSQEHPAASSEDALLSVSVISDTHLLSNWPIEKAMLAAGLDNIYNNDKLDAVIVAGDLTNFGDDASMDIFFDLFDGRNSEVECVFAAGNHDIGYAGSNEGIRQSFIANYNELTDNNIEKIYYSTLVGGYRFIVLGDEGNDTVMTPYISQEQLDFLEAELTEADRTGLPAFVVCHWPVDGTNGERLLWDNGDINNAEVKNILSRHKNVFYLSGHLHEGINGEFSKTLFGISCAETVDNVNYINIPTFGQTNRCGIPWSGTGFQMEVYDDCVVFKGVNFLTSNQYESYVYEFALSKDESSAVVEDETAEDVGEAPSPVVQEALTNEETSETEALSEIVTDSILADEPAAEARNPMSEDELNAELAETPETLY